MVLELLAALPPFILATIAVALFFDFVNGFHDTANAIATVVGTKVLSPLQAVSLAAVFNLLGPLVIGTAVAKTISSGILPEGVVKEAGTALIFSCLAGAIAWDLITWYWGLPTSSSHALVGGLIGAGVAAAGMAGALWPSLEEGRLVLEFAALGLLAGLGLWGLCYLLRKDFVEAKHAKAFALAGVAILMPAAVLAGWLHLSGIGKVVVFMVVSPIMGLAAGFGFAAMVRRAAMNQRPGPANHFFRRAQLLSSAFFALNHGANDAQKTAGVITALLFAAGFLADAKTIPLWVIVAAASAMGLGTLFGGWRIIKTMATRITQLRPYQGFSAETGGGVVLTLMAQQGIPVSTTHAITTSIMGVGATHRLSAVRWGVGRRIVWAWVITIPASALMAAVVYLAARAVA
ncbi:MAG TPA: inorganic phosphate transporter [Candidatus Thermoplasmatota archaeon]|jgi:PiT family inorganic phosphate transporter|nr:inorganic phosphate transporter [Candidatus Thermoplasmatota archaeon]